MIKNSLRDLEVNADRFIGIYRGVIEDNSSDPLKAGRCKIRVWGLHTSSKRKGEYEGIPTSELPWSEPVCGIFGGSVSGVGAWTVPVQGSHVFLFFENGDIMAPRYFATVPGQPTVASDPTGMVGFNDPNKEYPRTDRLNEPDMHRLSRGVITETIIEYKNDNLTKNVATALGGAWSEPASTYGTVYPHNTTVVTHGGITLELDSTPNKKRFHIYHPSNTYIEIDNDGNMVIKNAGKKYEIIKGNHNIYIEDNRNLTVDGDVKNLTKGKKDDQVVGNYKVVATRIDLN